MEKITSKGVLKYRMPNILEAYDLLEASGVSTGNTSVIKLKRNIIKEMSPLIDFTSIEGISSYEELLQDMDSFVLALSEIADEVTQKAFGALKKRQE